MGTRARIGGLGIACVLAFGANDARADVCYELVNAAPIPAVYGPACYFDLDDLDIFDTLCVLNHLCCVPYVCRTVPGCWTTTLVRGATEAEFTCNITFEDAFQRWLDGALFLNYDVLRSITDPLAALGQPLTPELFKILHDLGESHLTRDLDWPTDVQMSAVRVIRKTGAGIVGEMMPSNRKGLTFGDVIILNDGVFDDLFFNPLDKGVLDFECHYGDFANTGYSESLRTLIHEFVHVGQYRNLGPNPFYAVYSLEFIGEGGDEQDIGIEQGAERVEGTFHTRALAADGTCDQDPPGAPSPAGEALRASSFILINDRAELLTPGGAIRPHCTSQEECDDFFGFCGGAGRVFPCYARAATAVGGIRVGVNAYTGRLRSGGAVDLRDRAFVEDSVEAATAVIQGNQVVVRGEVVQGVAAPSNPFTGFQVTYPPFGPNVMLEPGQTVTLEPGSYGSVVAKQDCIVYLAAGTYFFHDLNLDVDATIVVEDNESPTRLFVYTGLLFKGTLEANPAHTLVAVGNGGVELLGELNGTLLAPTGKVNIHGLAPIGTPSHFGAVVANSIELHQDRVFVHVPFEHAWTSSNLPPPPVATLTATLTSSGWSTGYCATLNIVNHSSMPSPWSVTLSMNGTVITGLWNAAFSSPSGIVEITPNQGWNATIPGNSTSSSVGFCASRTNPTALASVVAAEP